MKLEEHFLELGEKKKKDSFKLIQMTIKICGGKIRTLKPLGELQIS